MHRRAEAIGERTSFEALEQVDLGEAGNDLAAVIAPLRIVARRVFAGSYARGGEDTAGAAVVGAYHAAMRSIISSWPRLA